MAGQAPVVNVDEVAQEDGRGDQRADPNRDLTIWASEQLCLEEGTNDLEDYEGAQRAPKRRITKRSEKRFSRKEDTREEEATRTVASLRMLQESAKENVKKLDCVAACLVLGPNDAL